MATLYSAKQSAMTLNASTLDGLAEQSHHGHGDFIGFPHRKAHSLSTREFLLFLAIKCTKLSVAALYCVAEAKGEQA